MSAQESAKSGKTSTVNPGNEFIWIGMFDRNTHTRLYDSRYYTFGHLTAKTASQLELDGFDEHERAELGRALAARELSFAPEPDPYLDKPLDVVSHGPTEAGQIATDAMAEVVYMRSERLDVAS